MKTAIFIDASGREKPKPVYQCDGKVRAGEALYLGLRAGVRIYRHRAEMYFWNGSCCGGGGQCRHLHRPGEVVS